MPDIFISFKNEEKATAARLAARLAEAGYDVWSTDQLKSGERFEEEIATMLDGAKVVVVLWSTLAVQSDWVRAEAEAARRRGIALPAVIDDLDLERLPMLFRQVHVTDLRSWRGGKTHPGYLELLGAIRALMGAGKTVLEAPPVRTTPPLADEDELWDAITENPHQSVEEYRDYIQRYGGKARFAELARLRIARMEKEERRNRWNWGQVGSLLVALATLVGAVVAAGQWAVENPRTVRWVSDLFVTVEQRQAVSACRDWFATPVTRPHSFVPFVASADVANCEKASRVFGVDPDIKAMAAIAYVSLDARNDKTAADLATEAMDAGSAIGSFALGLLYLEGYFYTQDIGIAATHLDTASRGGVARADAALCRVADDNSGNIPGLSGDPVAYCQRAADAGDAIGQFFLGVMREYGRGVAISRSEAERLLSLAAAQGYNPARTQLGWLKESAPGADRNVAEALKLYQQARTEDVGAVWRLGRMIECGIGTSPDPNAAALLYEQAYQNNNNVAGHILGYSQQYDGRVDTVSEIRDVKSVSTGTNCAVDLRLKAHRLLYGLGVQQDKLAAEQIVSSAAEAGDSIAQFVLGSWLRDGLLGRIDGARAFQLFAQSASSNLPQAAMALGFAYQSGLGTAVDAGAAEASFRKARALGLTDADPFLSGGSR